MSSLKRPLQPMPPEVAEALAKAGLRAAYDARPPYQRNDYLAWIARARRLETRARRLAQMLDELGRGDVYMNMDWPPGRATS
ncbi:MAG: YdeI/OmpD-associated family protein [Paracoccaceae bacterium]|nr:YdeI/OmpD-associated family protein [Paracoccaceae bacterium]